MHRKDRNVLRRHFSRKMNERQPEFKEKIVIPSVAYALSNGSALGLSRLSGFDDSTGGMARTSYKEISSFLSTGALCWTDS